MPDQAAIQTQDLSKRYGAQVAVDRLNLSVAEGEVFGFLGPNGAGKTTTLLMLLGLTEPTSGSARVLGLDPRRRPIKVKRQVGYLQENMGFYRDLDARQMLAFIAELNDLARAGGRRARAGRPPGSGAGGGGRQEDRGLLPGHAPAAGAGRDPAEASRASPSWTSRPSGWTPTAPPGCWR